VQSLLMLPLYVLSTNTVYLVFSEAWVQSNLRGKSIISQIRFD
jgi:hypothetical protein